MVCKSLCVSEHQSYIEDTALFSPNGHHYTSMDHIRERQQYTSVLPSVPNCPTPMGVYGNSFVFRINVCDTQSNVVLVTDWPLN